jgi:hypothetical protein
LSNGRRRRRLGVGGYRITAGGGVGCLNSRVARRRSGGGGICRLRAIGGGFGCHWAVGAYRTAAGGGVGRGLVIRDPGRRGSGSRGQCRGMREGIGGGVAHERVVGASMAATWHIVRLWKRGERGGGGQKVGAAHAGADVAPEADDDGLVGDVAHCGAVNRR